MISIITACYNSEKTIATAIKSLLNQTCNNFEHIIIDGNSNDNTLKIVENYRLEYEKKNISLTIVSEKDEGLYDALNKGIRISKGDYIGILNADDLYEKNTVEILQKQIEMGKRPDIFMGACKIMNGVEISVKKSRVSKFITSRNFNHGSMFVKAQCYSNIGGYANDGNYYDDFMWYIKAIKKECSIIILPEVLYDFSCGGMSTRKSFKEVFRRIHYRYEAYRANGCSRFYYIECVLMEIGKYILIK